MFVGHTQENQRRLSQVKSSQFIGSRQSAFFPTFTKEYSNYITMFYMKTHFNINIGQEHCDNCVACLQHPSCDRWRRGVAVNALVVINKVTHRRVRLVLGWVTVCRRVNHLN